MTERDIKIVEAAEAVLIAMFGGVEMVPDQRVRDRLVAGHRDGLTVEWQQAVRYAKAALGFA